MLLQAKINCLEAEKVLTYLEPVVKTVIKNLNETKNKLNFKTIYNYLTTKFNYLTKKIIVIF